MNFFGHAAVATWRRTDPAFLLGAMLPDFCGMVRARLVHVGHEDVSAGIALHHHTDAVFHDAPTFVGLCARGVSELTGRGVERGTARAVAHIGTELLLDGVLLSAGGPRRPYLEALEAGAPERLGRHLGFRREEEGQRWQRLRARLVGWGIPEGYADPGFVADRVVGALRLRPRLAVAAEAEPEVRAWLPAQRQLVRAGAGALLDEVRRGMEAGTG